MTRTDDDTWGPDAGVGTTATLVATARALAHRAGLIDEPLVRASGELALRDIGGSDGLALLTDLLAVRTRFFDNFLTRRCAGWVPRPPPVRIQRGHG